MPNIAVFNVLNQILASLIAICKDSYMVYACGFDQNGKWEWFCESKWRCKNATQAGGIISPNKPLIVDLFYSA